MMLHHLAMRTRDLPKLLAFYSEVLGLRVISQSERSAWLDAHGVIVMLEAQREDEPSVPSGSMELLAFTIPPSERDRWRARLPIEAESDFTLYFRDPDGRRIGLSHHPTPPQGR